MIAFIPGYQSEPIHFWQVLYLLSIVFSASMCCWGLANDFYRNGLLKSNKSLAVMGICGIGGLIAQVAFPWGFFIHFTILFMFLPTGAAIVATLFSLMCFYSMMGVMFPRAEWGY